ncbi:hypothetical protein [Janthinobacterium fluminis]|uniref:Uncharacterized protein n=1 Tax=Janthinobacterium fluminis TaxID=2987524 RepID=A0ABT5JXF4_9BURK|nr:hypothetical protein [Janthinobacterium fluminis]MDC8757110.1 hypothetical protein [Janthinobacterium fluminis]
MAATLNVVAGRDLNVGTLATSSSQNYIHDEANYRKENRRATRCKPAARRSAAR